MSPISVFFGMADARRVTWRLAAGLVERREGGLFPRDFCQECEVSCIPSTSKCFIAREAKWKPTCSKRLFVVVHLNAPAFPSKEHNFFGGRLNMSYARRSDQDTPNHTSRPAAPHSRRLRTSLIGLALVSLFAQAAAPAARAGSITNYTINFTTSSGTAPTSGSFTYNSTIPQFSNFFVTWDGITFNLTGSANNPFTGSSGCSGEASTAAYAFEIMSQTVTGCPSTPVYDWLAEYITTSPAHVFFSFLMFTAPGKDDIAQNLMPPPPPESAASGQGFSWTITPVVSATPEPSSLLLFGTSLLGIGPLIRRYRRKS